MRTSGLELEDRGSARRVESMAQSGCRSGNAICSVTRVVVELRDVPLRPSRVDISR